MSERRHRLISLALLVPILLLAAGVRILGLGNTDLWGDEAFSVMASLGPVGHLLGMLSGGEPSPPLYPFMLVGWLRLFGHSEFISRLPSAFVGIASVAVAASFAREFVAEKDGRAGVVAAAVAGLLVAFNPIQVWYSQEARMYAQLSFFAGLSALALLRLWRGRRYSTTLYVVALLGAMGSHYYGLFIPLAHGLAVLPFAWRRRDFFLRWIRAAIIAGILYLPWVAVALKVFTSYYGARPGTVNLPAVALSAWVRVAAGWSLSWEHALGAAAMISALVVIGLIVRPRSETDGFARAVLATWLFTPYVAGFLISLVRPMYAERYLVVSSLAFCLLMTRGIVGVVADRHVAGERPHPSPLPKGEGMDGRRDGQATASSNPLLQGGPPSRMERGAKRWRRRAAGMAMLGGALAVALGPLYNVWIGRYLKSAYNTHMKMVDALARPGDAVILDGTSQLPLYHYYLKKPFPTFPLPENLPLNPGAVAIKLAGIARKYTGVWVFLYATPDYDPTYFIPRWLTTNAYRAFDIWEVNGRLQYYRFAAPETLTSHAAHITLGDSLRLVKYAWRVAAYAAGASIPIALSWQWLPTRLSGPRVALRLVDATGFTWAQSDQDLGGGYLPAGSWPVGQVQEDHHGLMIPPGTPPGAYQLLLNAYSADHPSHFAASGAGAAIVPGGISLGTINVTTPSRSVWPMGIAGYHATSVTFAGSLELLGYAASDAAKAGESGYLTLVWKALAAHPPVSRVRLALLASDGMVAEQRDLPLATSAFPPARWATGDVLREQYRLPIDIRLRSGQYRLAVQPLLESAKPALLGTLRVELGPTPVTVAPPEHPRSEILGGAIALAGFDLASNQVRPGATVRLTLHWRDVKPLDDDYKVFVHVLDGAQKVVAQRDQQPVDGKRPTSSWFAGDVILDPYTLTLPADLAPGAYPIEVGMYNPTDGKRLPVSLDGKEAGDRVILTTLEVGR